MTRSRKTSLITTITDIHFLSVHESCTHALLRNTKYLIIDGHVCFFSPMLSSHEGAFHDPGGLYRIVWGKKLLLMVVLASLVDCISLCPILKAQHCFLSLNGCFNPPSASHPSPPPPIPPPARPPPIDSIRDITSADKNHPKNQQHLGSL